VTLYPPEKLQILEWFNQNETSIFFIAQGGHISFNRNHFYEPTFGVYCISISYSEWKEYFSLGMYFVQ